MNLITCPNHNGIIIENRPCPKCGHPQVTPQGREPYRHLWAIKPPEQGVEVEESTSTATVDMEELKPGECRMTFPDGTSIDMGGIDMETGEYKPSPAIARLSQMTLDPVMFPSTRRTNVPMVKVAFSGSVEMTQEAWQEYCGEALEPGRLVTATISGYLPEPHGKWVKRKEKDELGDTEEWWETEGQVKVKVMELGRFELSEEVYSDAE